MLQIRPIHDSIHVLRCAAILQMCLCLHVYTVSSFNLQIELNLIEPNHSSIEKVSQTNFGFVSIGKIVWQNPISKLTRFFQWIYPIFYTFCVFHLFHSSPQLFQSSRARSRRKRSGQSCKYFAQNDEKFLYTGYWNTFARIRGISEPGPNIPQRGKASTVTTSPNTDKKRRSIVLSKEIEHEAK